MRYQCIIVEDNAVERDLLEVLLLKMAEVEVAGIFEDGLQARQFLQNHPVDIAFTDVDMPELSGIGLLKSLRQPPVFVFISAHSGYAADSYDLDGVDFIRKPVSPERLYRALEKAIEAVKQRGPEAESVDPEQFIVRTSEGINKLTPDSIIYAESKGNYSVLHLQDETQLMVLVTLKQLEEQLPPDRFIRIHKAYLVNWNLTGIIRKDAVVLSGKYELPIGDNYRKELADRITAFPTLGRKANRPD